MYYIEKQNDKFEKCSVCNDQSLEMIVAPCGHKFHEVCLDEQFDYNCKCP